MMFWRLALSFVFILFWGLSDTNAYADITTSDPNKHTFEHLRDVGVMHGFGDGNFYPDRFVSRAEALAIAMRLGYIPVGEFSGETYFSDVDPNLWYAPVVSRAAKTGLISTAKGVFRPEQAVSKAEFLAFLFWATDAPLDRYKNARNIATDIPNGEWLTPMFAYAKQFQIAHLPTDNLYHPTKALTRREVAVMTHRQSRLFHGTETTAQIVELQAAIQQFLAFIKESRYEEAEFHLHTLTTLSDQISRTRNNQDSVATRALSQSMSHLTNSFRSFRYGKNLSAISSLHLALKQAQRAEAKSEAIAPFAQDLSKLIHETLASLAGPKLAQLD